MERRQRVAPADARTSQTLRRLAWLLDDVIRIPGTNIRFGLDPLLGLLPVGGDIAGGALSAWIVVAAARLGAPPSVLLRMGGNILLDAIFGTVPVLGDLFDAGWKANRRNVELLQKYVERPAPIQKHSRLVLVLVIAVLLAAVVGAALLSYHIVRWILSLV